MDKTTKTVLIVAGVAALAYFGYKYLQSKGVVKQTSAPVTAGSNSPSSGSPTNSLASTITSAGDALENLFGNG